MASWKEREFGQRKGRIFAAFILLIVGSGCWTTGLQSTIREELFEYLQVLHWKLFASRPQLEHKVWIAAIDDDEIADQSWWPYPRKYLADMLLNLVAASPAVIGIDLVLIEDSSNQDADLAILLALGGPTNTVLAHPRAKEGQQAAGNQRKMRRLQVPFYASGRPAFEALPENQPGFVPSFATLDQNATGHGFINDDWIKEATFRRLPLLVRQQESVFAAFASEIARIALEAGRYDLLGSRSLEAVRLEGKEREILLMTDESGFFRPRLRPANESRFVSASLIRDPTQELPIRPGDIVIVGVTAFLADDARKTAFGEMPGVEIHAQIVESILSEDYWWRPSFAIVIEILAALATSVLVLWIFPDLRLATALGLLSALIAATVGFELIVMEAGRLLIDPSAIIGPAAVLFLSLYAVRLMVERQRRKLAETDRLTLETQLEVARDIQNSILVNPSKIARLPSSIRLEAELVQSNFVGGDFYDALMIDDERLFLVVADVSGKGWSGAFFMAMAKAFLQSCALSNPGGPAEIVAAAEREIMRNNPHGLFVTAVAAVLNVRTGILEICNAGHPPPLSAKSGQLCQVLKARPAPPIGMVEGFVYASSRHQLHHGETLLMYTDGFADLTDKMTGESISNTRNFLDSITDKSGTLPESKLIVETAIGHGKSPEDDITLLIVRYN